jgi:hypothetical protein
MPVKAKGGAVVASPVVERRAPTPGDGWRYREEVDFPEKEMVATGERGDREIPEVNPDALVMVLMPSETWKAFQDLAVAHGGSTAEVMSVALKLLNEKINEGNGDGA